MKKNLTRKLIESHLLSGEWAPGGEIAVKIDQTLTQDATGTLAFLEFAALGLDSVQTEISASYVDHNLLQTDYKNADDHRFLMTSAMRYGVYFSPPGNGVSHPVHMERFGAPGKTLLGADSHTSTAGALAMIAIGTGGLDVALAMAGEPFHMKVPKVMGVKLTKKLKPWVAAKDVILEMLRRHSVNGGVGKIIEYWGPGVKTLTATDRATIANMGAELGATTTVFPSDEMTRDFLERHGRVSQWTPLEADPNAEYDETDEIDLSAIEPLIACPSSPDNIKRVVEVEGTPVAQVIVGSSVNFSYKDLMVVCKAMKGRTAHPGVSFEINPGSKSVLENVERAGGTVLLNHAGARVHQSGCLGCIGMGQAPPTKAASVRTFPRNFKGRSGTDDDYVYLSSPETAVAAAIFGSITDPRKLGAYPRVVEPKRYLYNESVIIKPMPPDERKKVEIISGPNIIPFPDFDALPDSYEGRVVLKTGDNVSTDDILPAGNRVLPFRSNIPKISEFAFELLDRQFRQRCKDSGGGIIVGGENYGQGSSREHAAIVPRYLGIRIKAAKSFARIHRANLVNFGILPLLFSDPSEYSAVEQGDVISLADIRKAVESSDEVIGIIKEKGRGLRFILNLSPRERACILEGGLINRLRKEKGHKGTEAIVPTSKK
ncbi:MAG TPA: aconitate hydratase [Deltaproteobacteria bacterium]|nr:MAG: aconitate hydratase [Deltaproteobacteria bacterium GWA2_55_82]OGQ65241.1 MAG: aconitate hydratase [Deltaproteobacteria bacterium RIFCSPLOWO2_02_FULL_55_12]OIJ74801.1 MAG: aconitate hydratase [Deltaproteobacteria bacterium GWC2_55_46]HBG45730.1 aconitate hydratase [Deltaproteobacteria bacterium]HCY11139.1 aconitate hydratase [Deltaproteobacteria bacterium]